MRRGLQFLPLLLLPLLASGCVTHKLWTESGLDEWNEPAPNPNLRLYQSVRPDDVLVVYDEYSERRETTRARAFYLQQNQGLLLRHDRPHFVSVRAASGLPPLPTFYSEPLVSLKDLYAIGATNNPDFTLYEGKEVIGSYTLPVYADGVGRAERVALTPVAVTMDATVVAGAAGCLVFYCLANGNTEWKP